MFRTMFVLLLGIRLAPVPLVPQFRDSLRHWLLPPSPPVDVNLHVADGYALNVSFAAPVLPGGHSVDAYRVEWDTQALVEEAQAVTVSSTPVNEVKVVSTTGADVNEVQVVKTVGTGDGSTVVEIQKVNCDASGGTIRLEFDGHTTPPNKMGRDSR